MRIKSFTSIIAALSVLPMLSQNAASDTTAAAQLDSVSLQEVTVTHRRASTVRMDGAVDAVRMGRQELFKAACCNLGESFTTNPSVDVNYSDAATGAKQIKLLGLSGTYVQMLTENMPNWRGAAAPYALGYVPGPWMKSIQVSKGASSVRNGYESITGQIDVEYLKPEDEQGATINLYTNTDGRIEANADANLHMTPCLNTEVLVHYENDLATMDHNNDAFRDKPNVRQVNVQNRWDWLGETYIFHGGLALLDEKRESGQTDAVAASNRFNIRLNTKRYEGYMKHAFVLNRQHGTNIALMSSMSMHIMDAMFGYKSYDVNEKNAYAQLMFETNFTERHNLSAGLSLNHDYLGQHVRMIPDPDLAPSRMNERETVPGAYAQYTFNASERIIIMAGLRADHSNQHGTFVTPRFHVKFAPSNIFSLRASAGKGFRTVHPLAENNYLLASGRTLVIDSLKQEEAWNYGTGIAFNIPIHNRLLKINAEYYYTLFSNQAVVDLDSSPWTIHIGNLDGHSYSRTFQIDASYTILPGLDLTAAYRLNDVKCTIGGQLREKPLTSRYKGLFTASYHTPLGLWQLDVTLQLNGGGRMPTPYYTDTDDMPSWSQRFHAYEQLNAQLTRWFRHFSIYIGGENLTGKRQHHPIIAADQPWSRQFDPTMVWGPVSGAMGYVGIRINLGRTL